MSLFEHIPHPHIARREAAGAPTVAAAVAQVHGPGLIGRLNAKLGLAITNAVGTMWSAYIFTVLALVSLPAVLTQAHIVAASAFPHALISVGLIALVAWVAQTFLQLVLLPIIIVGQNVQAAASDARSQATYDDAVAVLDETRQLQAHLAAQDDELTAQTKVLGDIMAKVASA